MAVHLRPFSDFIIFELKRGRGQNRVKPKAYTTSCECKSISILFIQLGISDFRSVIKIAKKYY